MLGILRRVFDANQRTIDSLNPTIVNINSYEQEFEVKSDIELLEYSKSLKQKIREQMDKDDGLHDSLIQHERAILDEIVPEAFALVREVFKRTYGERSYDEQIMVGILLHRGYAAEQKTGEGKTHAAVHPMYLNALTGRGAHLVTVNDYLAKRDAEWMGFVYARLGLTIGCINNNQQSFLFSLTPEEAIDQTPNAKEYAFGDGKYMRPVSRREAYAADVTYGTNNEFGFDYLRDNMAHSFENMVQTNPVGEVGVHHFTIVDEVDSILIDEARTPLIISQPAEESNELYVKFASLVKRLNPGDFELDEKAKQVILTDLGVKKIENWLGITNLFDDFTLAHHLEQSLKAQYAYIKDIAYVVQDGQVHIVDEFTGRLMEGRRFSEGLHQALEAKENVAIQKESKTVATVTFQNYFRLYEKLAGMSATIVTEAEEFHKIYQLDSVSVPTHRPTARIDHPDRIFKTQRAKWKAIVDDIETVSSQGQPILVGTTSVENNELVSQLLKRRGITHEVLNAKNHAREADIIADAGQKRSVTVATNMAGRGTDIKLGDGVKEAGGLYVIGTERHEARRIDNQLRGRAGRQGDPGISRFYVAMDDNLMRIFGGDRMAGIMNRLNIPDDMPIESGMISKTIEGSQQKVEGYNFDIRKHLVEYDDVINKQREIIYARRRRLLEMGEKDQLGKDSSQLHNELLQKAKKVLVVTHDHDEFEEEVDSSEVEEFINQIQNEKEKLGEERYNQLVRYVFLTSIDRLWMDHIDALDELRAGVGLRGYGQRDPLVEFKNEGYAMFERLISEIDFEIIQRFKHIKVEVNDDIPQLGSVGRIVEDAKGQHQTLGQFQMNKTSSAKRIPAESARTNSPTQQEPQQPVVKSEDENINRNDPCPCGSGKKYKNCGLKNTPEHKQQLSTH
ncbi:preprotein translocase subunit SecA [bacterium]|uniref:Protein translocase subunit SecA n=2 Tax=Katanobacteria TaxID=422282 RepID=A0A2M7X2N8_UNCKA|nr:preprotein translocase subunit SecA [bacterium]PIP56549.1 MAG: preprotein translocase subunit SecA [candidate division WWE3 bacterium CG22_combo_CG10-13_8_21_14_all_39_12]PJA40271.1 MAG: preprotein translocase subunit SecA [candidate division WWE3 bacterium CG_4_9_14_3_um_filter_39_7]